MEAYKITTTGNFGFDSMHWLVIADSYTEAIEKFKKVVTWKAESILSIAELKDFTKVIIY